MDGSVTLWLEGYLFKMNCYRPYLNRGYIHRWFCSHAVRVSLLVTVTCLRAENRTARHSDTVDWPSWLANLR